MTKLTGEVMSPKIAILGYTTKRQKGQQALLVSRSTALREVMPEARFFVFAKCPEDEDILDGVEFLDHLSKAMRAGKIVTLKLFVQALSWSVLHKITRANFNGLIKE